MKDVTCCKLPEKPEFSFRTSALFVSCGIDSKNLFYDASHWPDGAELKDWIFKQDLLPLWLLAHLYAFCLLICMATIRAKTIYLICAITLIFCFYKSTGFCPVNLVSLLLVHPIVAFGSSALESSVSRGILRGRPCGGVAIFVRSELASHCQLVCCSDQYVIIKSHDVLFVSVYMPCLGTANYQDSNYISLFASRHADKQTERESKN